MPEHFTTSENLDIMDSFKVLSGVVNESDIIVSIISRIFCAAVTLSSGTFWVELASFPAPFFSSIGLRVFLLELARDR